MRYPGHWALSSLSDFLLGRHLVSGAKVLLGCGVLMPLVLGRVHPRTTRASLLLTMKRLISALALTGQPFRADLRSFHSLGEVQDRSHGGSFVCVFEEFRNCQVLGHSSSKGNFLAVWFACAHCAGPDASFCDVCFVDFEKQNLWDSTYR